MVGSTIKVVVTAENGNVFESVPTAKVGKYEALEILSAKQTGQYTAEVTFSAPISADDKLEVTKGGNKVEFKSAIDSDKLGAELTFTDALTTGEYTVTLTPKDTTVKASSVTFTAARSELSEIVFLNDVLVMKDHYYNEGYAYVKGYDQFGNPKTLSGLNVVSGVGTFKSYDSDTGKITIKDTTKADNETGAFLTIKEVPVFVQYQEGTTVVSANKTLTVSTRAYVDDLTFGEVKKNSKETAKRLTLDELSSGLYYVEILSAADQYGNALSADDLQDQVEDHVLFVIPGDSGAFYTTGKFGELSGKTVLWLEDNNGDAKPGKMDLSITGAGGKTFKKEAIEIFDNPYIDVLTVDYPDLYEGMTESKKLNFSAIDQYGDDVNIWDFRPHLKVDPTQPDGVDETTLVFGDENGMTTRSTEIKVSGGAFFNTVEVDTKAKEFKVTINVGAMDAKDMAVFTVTTAGTKVATRTVTIGERGKAAKVASTFASTKKLDPGADWNINADVEFVDVNGNKMTRNKNNADYPFFYDGTQFADANGDGSVDNISNEALDNDAFINRYVWTVSEKKITNATDALPATALYDGNGKINGAETGGRNIVVNAANPKDVYITVFAFSGNKYYIIDSATTRVTMIDGTVEKVETVAPGTLYAAKGSTDDEAFKVKLTNKVGESWKVDATSVVAGGIFGDLTTNNTISGALAEDLPGNTTKTIPVSVYFDARGNWEGGLVGTVDLTYTNVTPVPTTTKFQYTVDAVGTNGLEPGRVGVGFTKDLTDTEFVADVGGATYAVDATGKLTIDNFNELQDNLAGWVVDQYSQPITGTVVYLNGTKVTDQMAVHIGRNVWEFKNDNQGKAFYVTEKIATNVTVANPVSEAVDVYTTRELVEALKAGASSSAEDTIVVADNITLTQAITVAENDTLVIPHGLTVTANNTVTNNGTIRGEYDADGNITAATSGTLTVNGTPATTALAGEEGTITLPGSSLKLVNAVVSGRLDISGHVIIRGNVVFDTESAIAIEKDSTIKLDTAMSSLDIQGGFKILNDFENQSAAAEDSITVIDSTGTTAGTLTAGKVNPGYAQDETPAEIVISDGGASTFSQDAVDFVDAVLSLPDEDAINDYTTLEEIAESEALTTITELFTTAAGIEAMEDTEAQQALEDEIVALLIKEEVLASGKEWSDVYAVSGDNVSGCISDIGNAIVDAATGIEEKLLYDLGTAIDAYLAEGGNTDKNLQAVIDARGEADPETNGYWDLVGVDTPEEEEESLNGLNGGALIAQVNEITDLNGVTFELASGKTNELTFTLPEGFVVTAGEGTTDGLNVSVDGVTVTVTATKAVEDGAIVLEVALDDNGTCTRTITLATSATGSESPFTVTVDTNNKNNTDVITGND